ncbi:hypothetical protein D3C71_2014700 [compost metagenome]
MMRNMAGATFAIGPMDLALSSTAPPTATEYPTGSVFSNAETLSASAFTMVAGCVVSPIPAFIVMVGTLSRRQIVGCSSS